MILLCVSSLLPEVPSPPQCVGVSKDMLGSVDASCNRLLAVGLLVSAPLPDLHTALAQRGGGGGGGGGGGKGRWRVFVKANARHAVATPLPDEVKYPYLLRPLHISQQGLLLQVRAGVVRA